MDAETQFVAEEATFGSRREAEDYLTRALPLATRANPKYLTKAEGVETLWLTKSLKFTGSPAAGIQVAMDEEYTQYRAGVATVGAHQAEFSLADVEISAFTEPGDVTPDGEVSRGVLFGCVAPKCIRASWSGQPSLADKTDIYVQEVVVRDKILAAFVFLKRIGKAPT